MSQRYRIKLLPDDREFDAEAEQPVLSAAHRANILMAYSCRSGQCGSCRGRVLQGDIEYPRGFPAALSETEANQGFALFCSAHPRSDLTIEICPPDLNSC